MSKFPNQLAIVAVAATSAVALSVGLSERAAERAAAAAHEAELHAMEAEAHAAATEEAVAEEVAASETAIEEAVEEAVAEVEPAAEEPVTEEVAVAEEAAPVEEEMAEASTVFEAGESRPASIIGAAWAQEVESPMLGDLEGISFGLGREALPEEVAAWDIDIRPDGQGLPVGSGDVWTGEEVFVEKCSACHGDFGEAVGRWPVLAGGQGTLEDEDPVKTIGSYWPYLSTVFDYVHRAMPFGEAQSLTPDEVYAITAYLLYVNDLADDDFELSNENFVDVRLPNEPNFFMDDRADGEIPAFSQEPCMENCKETVEITMHASVLDVTPETEEEEAPAEEAMAEEAPAEEAATETAMTEEAPAEEPAAEVAAVDPALVAEGENVFRKCRSCHQVGEGATNRTGPALNGVVGATMGAVEGFRYSNGFVEANAEGRVWDAEALAGYLADPRGYMPGTKMSFAGLRSDEEIAAITAYLSTFEAE